MGIAKSIKWGLVLCGLALVACSPGASTATGIAAPVEPGVLAQDGSGTGTASPRPETTVTPFPSAAPSAIPPDAPVRSATASAVPPDTPSRSATPTLVATLVVAEPTSTAMVALPPSGAIAHLPTDSANATSACAKAQGRVETGTFPSRIIGRDQPYRVYLPPCYDSSGEGYPVLYMLHGYPYDDRHWDELGIDEAAGAGIASGMLPPFIIAMPAADNEGTYTNTSGGARSFEAVLVDEFMPFIESTYRVRTETAARAIGGMSRGGVWSLEIAFRHPDLFGAVGGHSAALNVNLAPPVYDPIYLAHEPGVRSLRIYLDAGRDDWVLPGMEQLHAALQAAGVAHDYVLFEGMHHDRYWATHVSEYLAFYAARW